MKFEEAMEMLRKHPNRKVTCEYMPDEWLSYTDKGHFVFEDGYSPENDPIWFVKAAQWGVDWYEV